MLTKSRLGMCSLMLLLVASSSHALQQIQIMPYSGLKVPGTLTMNFDKFDPSLGILQQVILEIDVDGISAGSAAYENEDPINSANVELTIKGDINAETNVTLSPLSAGVQTPEESTGLVSLVSDEVSETPDPDFAGPDWVELVGSTASGSDQDSATTDLGEYIGLDTFEVELRTASMFTATLESGFGQLKTEQGESEGTVTLTYIYIPEPTSLALLGVGSLVLLRRRRSA